MPQATFAHEGANIDFTPTSAVASGDVIVQGDLVGVACRPLAANEPGALAVTGVYDFLKATNVAYTVGTILYWDDTNNIVTATATGNKQITSLQNPSLLLRLTAGHPVARLESLCHTTQTQAM